MLAIDPVHNLYLGTGKQIWWDSRPNWSNGGASWTWTWTNSQQNKVWFQHSWPIKNWIVYFSIVALKDLLDSNDLACWRDTLAPRYCNRLKFKLLMPYWCNFVSMWNERMVKKQPPTCTCTLIYVNVLWTLDPPTASGFLPSQRSLIQLLMSGTQIDVLIYRTIAKFTQTPSLLSIVTRLRLSLLHGDVCLLRVFSFQGSCTY